MSFWIVLIFTFRHLDFHMRKVIHHYDHHDPQKQEFQKLTDNHLSIKLGVNTHPPKKLAPLLTTETTNDAVQKLDLMGVTA